LSFIARPFDPKIITSGLGISHVDIGHVAILEELLDLLLNGPIGNIALGNQSPARCISVEGEPAGKHVDREAGILGILFAVLLVDENWPGQR
jgi:hypothetical protein